MGVGTSTNPYDYSAYNTGTMIGYGQWMNQIRKNWGSQNASGDWMVSPEKAYSYWTDMGNALKSMGSSNDPTVKNYASIFSKGMKFEEGGNYNDWLDAWASQFGNDWRTAAEKYTSYAGNNGSTLAGDGIGPTKFGPEKFMESWKANDSWSAFRNYWGLSDADKQRYQYTFMQPLTQNNNQFETDFYNYFRQNPAGDEKAYETWVKNNYGNYAQSTDALVDDETAFFNKWKDSAWQKFASSRDYLGDWKTSSYQDYLDKYVNPTSGAFEQQMNAEIAQLYQKYGGEQREDQFQNDPTFLAEKQKILDYYQPKIADTRYGQTEFDKRWANTGTNFGKAYGIDSTANSRMMGQWLQNFWANEIDPMNEKYLLGDQKYWDEWEANQSDYFKQYYLDKFKDYNDENSTKRKWLLENAINRPEDSSQWTPDQWSAYFYSADAPTRVYLQGIRSLKGFGALNEDKDFQAWTSDYIKNGDVQNKLNPGDYTSDTTSDYYKNLQTQASEGYGDKWTRSAYESAIAPYAQQYGNYIQSLKMQQGKTGMQSGFAKNAMQNAKYQLAGQGISALSGARQQQEDYKYQAQAQLADITNSDRAIRQSVDQWNKQVDMQKDQFRLYVKQQEDAWNLYQKQKKADQQDDWLKILEVLPYAAMFVL